jgi:hypothetical protein
MFDLKLTIDTVHWEEYAISDDIVYLRGTVDISVNGRQLKLVTDHYFNMQDEWISYIIHKPSKQQKMVDDLNSQIASIFLPEKDPDIQNQSNQTKS